VPDITRCKKRYLCVSRLVHPLSYCSEGRNLEMKGLK